MTTEHERWTAVRRRLGYGLEDGEGPFTIEEAERVFGGLSSAFDKLIENADKRDATLGHMEESLGRLDQVRRETR